MIDFEDMLRAAVWGIEEHPDVAEQVRGQYRHFVVDEYQDVNPLQQRLLEAWLGGRDDLTVVGDASQTIYSFTGATSSYLVDFPRRHRDATVVRLVRDYRSTPQVVGLANAVISQARGAEARLRLELVGQRPPGPEPELRIFTDEPAEAAAVAARCADADRRPAPRRGRSPCCSGPTRSPRRTRRRSPRPACRTWCRARSGSSSGPRCARRWWRCGPPPARSRGRRRCRPPWSRRSTAVGWAAGRRPGRRRRPGAVGGARRPGRSSPRSTPRRPRCCRSARPPRSSGR